MWTSRSGGGTAKEQIQAGMGRPLALAGIEIEVDVKGSSPVPMIYDDSERAESLLERFSIPLRIGDEVRQTDGTAGFYLHGEGGGFSVFHQCRCRPSLWYFEYFRPWCRPDDRCADRNPKGSPTAIQKPVTVHRLYLSPP